MRKRLVAVCLSGLCLLAAAAENPRKLKADPTQEYYVYLPKDHDPKKTYWLFVAVHGLGGDGKGALGWESFAEEGQCIVVGPSFKGEYQFPSRGAGEKLKSILRELAKEFKFHPKVFITGFSAGAQFAHRFALENPHLVAGCAAHSAGSWANPPATARFVPFLVTCGLDDKENDRIGGARRFAQELEQKKFKVETMWFRGVAHAFCDEARSLTKEHYWSVTTGMTTTERKEAQEGLASAEAALKEGKYAEAAAAVKRLTKLKGKHAEQADDITRRIEEAGKERLAKADEQAKADPAAAQAELEKIQEDFTGTRVAAGAVRRLAALKRAAKEASKGAGAAPEAEPLAPKKEPSPAEINARCRSWLDLARNYIANNKPAEARRQLLRIIEAYPDTEHAKTARRMLDEL